MSVFREPQRILLVRLSALGDVVVTTPIIASCRARYPHAQIDFAVAEAAAPLLQYHPNLRMVHIIPQAHIKLLIKAKKWTEAWAMLRTIKQTLKSQHYDLVVDCQGLLKSAVVAWLTAAPMRVSLGGKEGSAWLMTQVVARDSAPQHISGPYRDLALSLDWPVAPFDLCVVAPKSAHDQAAEKIASLTSSDYLVFCPYTTRPQKHWFDASWIALAKRLAERMPHLEVVILGGLADRDAAEQLAKICGVHSLAGKTSLLETVAIIEKAVGVVGVDTGMTHVATAMRRPTVAIFGSTCPYLQTNSPYTAVLYEKMSCSPCHRRPTCDGQFDCMQQYSADQVESLLTKLIA